MGEAEMTVFKTVFVEYIIPALSAVVMAIAGWVGTVIVKYLGDKSQSRQVRDALDDARKALMTAVADVMQTYVNSLKEAGEWDETSEQEARTLAFIKAQTLMGPLVWKLINEFLTQDGQSNATEWCMMHIDSFVEPIKKARADRKLAEAQIAQLRCDADTKPSK